MRKGIEGVFDRLASGAVTSAVMELPAVTAAVRIEESEPYVIQDLPDSSTYSSGPYGALPFIKNATTEELLDAAARCSAAKYWYQNNGDYYRAWKSAWRERLIERILEGITRFSIGTD